MNRASQSNRWALLFVVAIGLVWRQTAASVIPAVVEVDKVSNVPELTSNLKVTAYQINQVNSSSIQRESSKSDQNATRVEAASMKFVLYDDGSKVIHEDPSLNETGRKGELLVDKITPRSSQLIGDKQAKRKSERPAAKFGTRSTHEEWPIISPGWPQEHGESLLGSHQSKRRLERPIEESTGRLKVESGESVELARSQARVTPERAHSIADIKHHQNTKKIDHSHRQKEASDLNFKCNQKAEPEAEVLEKPKEEKPVKKVVSKKQSHHFHHHHHHHEHSPRPAKKGAKIHDTGLEILIKSKTGSSVSREDGGTDLNDKPPIEDADFVVEDQKSLVENGDDEKTNKWSHNLGVFDDDGGSEVSKTKKHPAKDSGGLHDKSSNQRRLDELTSQVPSHDFDPQSFDAELDKIQREAEAEAGEDVPEINKRVESKPKNKSRKQDKKVQEVEKKIKKAEKKLAKIMKEQPKMEELEKKEEEGNEQQPAQQPVQQAVDEEPKEEQKEELREEHKEELKEEHKEEPKEEPQEAPKEEHKSEPKEGLKKEKPPQHIELHEHKHFEHHEHINHPKHSEHPIEEYHPHLQHEEHPEVNHIEVPVLEHPQHQFEHHFGGHHTHEPEKGHWFPMEPHHPHEHQEHHMKPPEIIPEIVLEDTSELHHPMDFHYADRMINHPHGLGLSPLGHHDSMGAYSAPKAAHVNQQNTTQSTRTQQSTDSKAKQAKD